ncbi:DUF188 domain-containing protein [Bacillus aquiflavi]|uniref:UPF0178 protein H1Z61_01575 n=1 Tax=Bacillus aquiflavi TaxID=2672567 RepID=A0A7W1X1B3_9BACI|nr:DUF188 domain-containing protein [Bacillus aquiflavi]MBA4535859.1 DUF188 domain-containing protein [Bacillus aquiflavi]
MNEHDIPTLFVDADACPVKAEIVEIGKLFTVEIIFVASYAHMINDTFTQNWVYVDNRKEEVDLYILNHVSHGDIVVTHDIGLASSLLVKEVHVLSPRGMLFEEKFISTALHMRYLAAKARRNGIYGKGPKRFNLQDRKRFKEQLIKILSENEGF